MEARIKSRDSTRSLAQLVWAKRISTIYCLNLSYALFMKIYSDFATVPADCFKKTVSPCLELVTRSRLMHGLVLI